MPYYKENEKVPMPEWFVFDSDEVTETPEEVVERYQAEIERYARKSGEEWEEERLARIEYGSEEH